MFRPLSRRAWLVTVCCAAGLAAGCASPAPAPQPSSAPATAPASEPASSAAAPAAAASSVAAPSAADPSAAAPSAAAPSAAAPSAAALPASSAGSPSPSGPAALAKVGGGPVGLDAALGRRLLPAGNPWNTRVDASPVDPASATLIASIGLAKHLHPDFGANYGGGPFGIPYIVVPGTQKRVPVSFDYAGESDKGPYPIPGNAPIEGGASSSGDRHVLVVDRDHWVLYELFDAHRLPSGAWHAGSGAVFPLNSNAFRPAGWTSADAAGLPILPGLVRYDEVAAGHIDHALRFTVNRTRNGYVSPARHAASSNSSAALPPMGMRVRLKASFNISGYPAPARVILQALKTYGMIVADNGSDWYLSGTADARWNDDAVNTLKQVPGNAFEVVRMGPMTTG